MGNPMQRNMMNGMNHGMGNQMNGMNNGMGNQMNGMMGNQMRGN